MQALNFNKTMTLLQAIEMYQLHFIPSYIVDYCKDSEMIIVEESAHFESLSLDEIYTLSQGKNIEGILFCKDVTVKTFLVQEESDYGPLVVVLGNVTAQNIYVSGGSIYFRGDVSVAQNLIAGVYNHGEVSIEGTIKADLIYSSDHIFSYYSAKILKGKYEGYDFDDEKLIKKQYREKLLFAVKKGISLKDTKVDTYISPLQKKISKLDPNKTKKLKLEYLDLEDLPDAIFDNFLNIEELSLNNNQLNHIPKAVLKLKKLKTLNLQRNFIKTISEEIVSLENLEKLNLGWNRFTNPPTAIAQLPRLKSLNLSGMLIHDEPFNESGLNENLLEEFICQELATWQVITLNKNYSRLKKLDLSHTNLNFLFQMNGDMPNLIELNLNNCSFVTFPEAFFKCNKLQKLTYRLNFLETFSVFTQNFPLMKEFWFTIDYFKIKEDLRDQIGEKSYEELVEMDLHLIESWQFLETIYIHIRKTATSFISDIIHNKHWNQLIIEGNLDYFSNYDFLKEVVKRPNLKKVVEKKKGGDEELNIQNARLSFGID